MKLQTLKTGLRQLAWAIVILGGLVGAVALGEYGDYLTTHQGITK